MHLQKKTFVWLYSVLVLIDLACGLTSLEHLRVITKPLLLISLLVYFIVNAKSNKNTIFYIMVAALACSLAGDIFLLFETSASIYFTLGLASFLIAHLLFTATFIKRWNGQKDLNFKWIAFALLTYGTILFLILKNSLGPLKIPVLLYVLGILAMVVTAYKRKSNVPKSSFTLVFIGALFFVISDSVLAIHKFLFTIPLSHLFIMGTYAIAQYLITTGVLHQKDFGN